jgi:hypothetical protein
MMGSDDGYRGNGDGMLGRKEGDAIRQWELGVELEKEKREGGPGVELHDSWVMHFVQFHGMAREDVHRCVEKGIGLWDMHEGLLWADRWESKRKREREKEREREGDDPGMGFNDDNWRGSQEPVPPGFFD